ECTALYAGAVCQPEMMFWTPWTVASCPLSGIGFRRFAFSVATTAPAMPSFAATTPWMFLFVGTSICSKIVWAFVAFQLGTNFAGPFVTFFTLNSGFSTSSCPLLNQNAFASVGPPHSWAMTAFGPYVFFATMPLITPRAWMRPTW